MNTYDKRGELIVKCPLSGRGKCDHTCRWFDVDEGKCIMIVIEELLKKVAV